MAEVKRARETRPNLSILNSVLTGMFREVGKKLADERSLCFYIVAKHVATNKAKKLLFSYQFFRILYQLRDLATNAGTISSASEKISIPREFPPIIAGALLQDWFVTILTLTTSSYFNRRMREIRLP